MADRSQTQCKWQVVGPTLLTLILSSVGPVRIFTVSGSSASAVMRATSFPSLPGFLSCTAPRPRREASACTFLACQATVPHVRRSHTSGSSNKGKPVRLTVYGAPAVQIEEACS